MINIGSGDKFIEILEIVMKFLTDIMEPLVRDGFLLQKRKDGANDQTLLDLDFDREDIIREILTLQVDDYVYSVPDVIKPNEEPYKVFHKMIKSKEIYIKIKIKHTKSKFIYCISFHEARYSETKFPHRGG
ncbi:MAG: type II toxin-antitoxin system MqsR family toxin [Fusobacteriaceae bacterium]